MKTNQSDEVGSHHDVGGAEDDNYVVGKIHLQDILDEVNMIEKRYSIKVGSEEASS